MGAEPVPGLNAILVDHRRAVIPCARDRVVGDENESGIKPAMLGMGRAPAATDFDSMQTYWLACARVPSFCCAAISACTLAMSSDWAC